MSTPSAFSEEVPGLWDSLLHKREYFHGVSVPQTTVTVLYFALFQSVNTMTRRTLTPMLDALFATSLLQRFLGFGRWEPRK